MKTKTIEVYICEHCNKLYQRKHFAIYHEKMCIRNPNNKRACHDCIHLKKEPYIIYDYYAADYGGSGNRSVDLLHCDKIDSFLYPVSVKLKGNAFDLGDKLNQPFKKKCKHLEICTDHATIEEFLNSL